MDNLSDDQFDPAKIAETMKDKEAMKKAMEQIKEDKTMLPLVMKKFNSDQRIRRNLNNAAEQLKISREKKRTGRITGRLRTEEIKAQKREDISMAVAKSQAHFTEEDRTCVIISPKGIISPFYIKNREMIDEKYCMHSVYLSDTPFLILSPTIKISPLTDLQKSIGYDSPQFQQLLQLENPLFVPVMELK